ncbi:hypothetical protein R1flu_015770 [Riccia fluitans]|uniref:Uncharacterized protein n=1 Tax=Riccia fluitans TaxID=41844 RepID=A0ABD1YJX4_9MARC
MCRMGFCTDFIALTRAFVSEGHTRVHLNGRTLAVSYSNQDNTLRTTYGFGLEKSEEERAGDLQKKLQNKLGSYKSLETPSRAFLWGMNSESKPKTSLVSWSCINKTKSNGGLQVRPFHQVSEVLKMRYVGRLLNGEISDWATMGICALDDINKLLAQIQHSTCAPPTSNELAENTEQTNPQSAGSDHKLNSDQMRFNTSIEFPSSVCSLVSSLSGRMAEVQLADSPT